MGCISLNGLGEYLFGLKIRKFSFLCALVMFEKCQVGTRHGSCQSHYENFPVLICVTQKGQALNSEPASMKELISLSFVPSGMGAIALLHTQLDQSHNGDKKVNHVCIAQTINMLLHIQYQ